MNGSKTVNTLRDAAVRGYSIRRMVYDTGVARESSSPLGKKAGNMAEDLSDQKLNVECPLKYSERI